MHGARSFNQRFEAASYLSANQLIPVVGLAVHHASPSVGADNAPSNPRTGVAVGGRDASPP